MLALRLFKREFSVGAASLAGRGRDSPARAVGAAPGCREVAKKTRRPKRAASIRASARG